ncbi:MAG TPA: hypothetical protein VGH19_00745 [Verrucomicrobiae bacterium]
MQVEPPVESPSADDLSRSQKKFLLLLVLAAFAVRAIASIRDGFWQDEIWSLGLALGVQNWWEIFTRVTSTNSHLANTLWLHLLGFQENWGWYRLPAVLSGSAAVALVAGHPVFGAPRPRLLAAFLIATSFPLIHFSSEARGYAPAIFCALLAYFSLQQYWKKKSAPYLLLLHLSIIMGLLWHLTFVFIQGALTVWILWRTAREPGTHQQRLQKLPKFLLPHLVFAAALYLGYIRHTVNEGGSTVTVLGVFLEVFGMVLGGPYIGWPALFSVLVVLGVIFWNITRHYRQGSDEWLFRLMVLLVIPSLLSVIQNNGTIYYRFFVICFPFFYIVLAEQIDLAWRSSSAKRIIATVALIAITCVQTARTEHFLKYGRGNYLDAVFYMATTSSKAELHVGSDHDFRNNMILSYYRYFLPKEITLVYHEWKNWPPGGVDWVIGHVQEAKPHFIRDGILYRWDKSYETFGGDAGATWHLYRKIGPANTAAKTSDAPSSN